jgi:hypothetical protein
MTDLKDRAQVCLYLGAPRGVLGRGLIRSVSTRYVPPGGWFYKSLK